VAQAASTSNRSASAGLSILPNLAFGGLVGTAGVVLVWLLPIFPAWVKRYCVGHPVAIACVILFSIAVAALIEKWRQVLLERRQLRTAGWLLQQLGGGSGSEAGDGNAAVDEPPSESLRGPLAAAQLGSLLSAQPLAFQTSWVARRLLELVERQRQRGHTQRLEEDLQELADREADRLHESYGLIRIITWAMPMLGFLGTVLGISATLGTMDTELLASGSQDAMDQLTAGLYVAFDTTAMALVLTVMAMFLQFATARTEQGLTLQLDTAARAASIRWLEEPVGRLQPTEENLERVLRELTVELLASTQGLVERQASLWMESFDRLEQRWRGIGEASADTVRLGVSEALAMALGKHVEQYERVQAAGAAQIDSRWQQWQTSLSDQARALHTQQREMGRQSELLERLVAKGDQLEQLDRSLQHSLERITEVDRFHEAAVCMTEAVAVLATQLERIGIGGRLQPRRVVPMSGGRASHVPPAADPTDRERDERGRAA
jgi:biopolymer transport protein ExbB/TolQ